MLREVTEEFNLELMEFLILYDREGSFSDWD